MGRTSTKEGSDGADASPTLAVVHPHQGSRQGGAARLRFGDFELDVDSGELTRDGEPIKLQPQPAKVLHYLAERSGQVVGRRDLQVHLWGEDRFVDFEQGLNYCIKTIRRALDDNVDCPTYVETIPRRGYRFKAPVEVVDDHGESVTSAPTSPRARRWLWLLGGLAIAGGLAVSWPLLRPAGTVAGKPLRLAVLPFKNISELAEYEPLAAGLTAELITRLTREHGKEVSVIAQTSAMAYAGSDKTAAEIGSELGVDLLLTGSLHRVGDTLRVSTRLLRVDDETYQWAETTERPVGDGDWEEWAGNVTAAVARELGLERAADATPAFELPAGLYQSYVEGIYLANVQTAEGRQRALETLADVQRRAPGFAPAYLAWAKLRVGIGDATEFLPEALAALERAVTLDPEYAEAYLETAWLRGFYLYDWKRGRESLQRAMELRPRSAEAYQVEALYLSIAGDVDKAMAAMNLALAIDPLSPRLNAGVAWGYFFDRDYEKAIEVSRRSAAIIPGLVAASSTILHAALKLGDTEEALAQARQMTGRDLGSLEEYWRFSAEGTNPGVRAIAQIELGDHDAAFASLMQACHEHSGWPLAFLRIDPRFDAVRQEPGFLEVLKCTDLAD